MLSIFWIVMLTSILACIVTTIGILVISKYASWGKRNVIYFMYFAAGILISVSFLHIMPKSFELNSFSPIFLLAGFFLLYAIDQIIMFSERKAGKAKRSFGIVSATGIGIHSFIDGIIYSITFSVSVFTGVIAAIGMVLHEFPEGIITFLVLFKSGFKKSKSAGFAFLVAAISTPLGALISWPFISAISTVNLGSLLALSAGALIYVGATKFLPKAEKEYKKWAWLALLLGIVVAVGIILSKGG